MLGFPDSSAGKESTCNAGNPGSIPGSGRSTGEGIGYPLQYSWAFLVAQLVKSACNVGDPGTLEKETSNNITSACYNFCLTKSLLLLNKKAADL